MPFNGSGVYTAPAADFPVVTQTVISSTHFNNTINDIATALSTCLTKDGQQTATANIPFGGFRATNVGITAIAGSVGTPAINVSDTGTGLYRSAASELAVTVAGTQRARFDGTGLIVTGVGTFSGATSTTTLTASTSVLTPLVQAASGAALNLGADGATKYQISTGGSLLPAGDNTQSIGSNVARLANVFTPIIDSGTTGPLSLKTNNGSEGFRLAHVAGALVNRIEVNGQTTGNNPRVLAQGTDTNVSLFLGSQGTGSVFIDTNTLGNLGVEIRDVASSTRRLVLSGSNGGNPTISTTAGSLAITPAVVIAGASLSVGTTPASAGDIRVPSNGSLQARNATNSGDLALVAIQTVNTVNDILVVGSGSSGILGVVRSGSGAPTASDLASGRWTVWRDTTGNTTKIYHNNASVILASAAFT